MSGFWLAYYQEFEICIHLVVITIAVMGKAYLVPLVSGFVRDERSFLFIREVVFEFISKNINSS